MVQLDTQRDPARHQFILSPNCSLKWREAKQILAAVAIVELLIGGAFFWVGMTLVLPYSGLETLVLCIAFYQCLLRGARREVVLVDQDRVVVQRGRQRPADQQEFPRAWVRVVLERGVGWQPSRLKLRSAGREMQIGDFLTEDEREALAGRLRSALTREGALGTN